MLSLILILSTFVTVYSFASDFVFLTSVKFTPKQIEQVEKIFLKQYPGPEPRPVIVHNAGPKELTKYLSSEDTVGLVWLSHAAKEKKLQNGLSAESIIMDVHGNDVKNFFTRVNSQLKFLGIVGCQALPIIDGFTTRGNYKNFPNLTIKSFKKKVLHTIGLKKTLKASVEALAKQTVPSSESRKVYLDFYRTNLKGFGNFSGAWAQIGDQVLGYYEENSYGFLTADIDENVWNSLTNKNIKLFRDKSTNSDLDMGKIDIAAQIDGSWKLFSKPSGEPIGGSDQQLYVFKATR